MLLRITKCVRYTLEDAPGLQWVGEMSSSWLGLAGSAGGAVVARCSSETLTPDKTLQPDTAIGYNVVKIIAFWRSLCLQINNYL